MLYEVGYTYKVFMNDTTYANEEAFLNETKLLETLRNWIPMSSSESGCFLSPDLLCIYVNSEQQREEATSACHQMKQVPTTPRLTT
jgi:hypothetical protein